MEISKFVIEDQPPIYYRKGTTDELILGNYLRGKWDYEFMPGVKPKIIFDCGANTGIVSLVMRFLYPEAEIFAFEPVASNFEILQMNVKEYPNIKAIQSGLSNVSGRTTIYHSDDETNLGGFSLFTEGCIPEKHEIVNIMEVNEAMALFGRPEMIKIDTEGSEFDILTSISELNMRNVKWIFGEMHGRRDFDTLSHLEKDFDLGLAKPMNSRIFPFYAKKRLTNSGQNKVG